MPISYEGKDYSFAELEEHIKRTKPDIKSPGGYVAEIEKKQHSAKDVEEQKDELPNSHPFDDLDNATKLHVLRQIHGIAYNPDYVNPKYDDLNLTSKTGIDKLFNTERVGMIQEKLYKLANNDDALPVEGTGNTGFECKDCGKVFSDRFDYNTHKKKHTRLANLNDTGFSGSVKADTKKTGEDVVKEKEKPFPTSHDEDFGLGAKLRIAIKKAKQRQADQEGDFDTDYEGKPKVKETEGKGDPEYEPVEGGSATKVPVDEDDTAFGQETAKVKQAINFVRGTSGETTCLTCDKKFNSYDDYKKHEHGQKNAIDYGAFKGKGDSCPQCKDKDEDYKSNCPTCEGTGKQMYPYHEGKLSNILSVKVMQQFLGKDNPKAPEKDEMDYAEVREKQEEDANRKFRQYSEPSE